MTRYVIEFESRPDGLHLAYRIEDPDGAATQDEIDGANAVFEAVSAFILARTGRRPDDAIDREIRRLAEAASRKGGAE